MREAAQLALKALADGPRGAITDRATQYVSEETWTRLIRGWRPRRCRQLARAARYLLRLKKDAHSLVAKAAYQAALWVGLSPICRVFVQELARNLPIPMIDEHLTAVARAVQLTGIYACVVKGLDLVNCCCLRDVVHEEGKKGLQSLLQAGYEDWRSLPR